MEKSRNLCEGGDMLFEGLSGQYEAQLSKPPGARG